jgi:hypothetical protein
MLVAMEDIYDVLKLLITSARPWLSNEQTELATRIVEKHQAAVPVPDKAKVGGDAEAQS